MPVAFGFTIHCLFSINGNPVTGEGYDTQDNRSANPAPTRTRIPPGGYSSGLW
ncbi:hypothetical protein Phum_PHUM491820 [Pediculus humanus corporis]|uniref:Uncharacterized protein n=1 Tax=Pediculus humanus subsp. corporis TaxID=121224 RepID=E0VWW7_PEDHC|nr:uncharacterized protein Phum_PHUM491820 [Pediculus humanus corporis]EEB17873.1 hypothetical protein Phum_PHUM491820 [Pediculus humanus corporis]